MTGKTHMAISAATVAVLLAVDQTASRASALAPGSRGGPTSPVQSACAVAGLLLLGIVAGLFPDLDAPDSELQRLPGRTALRVGRYIRASARRPSLVAGAGQALVYLAALSFSMLLLGAGSALRAFTGHRGFTHTLWGALTFTALAAASAMLATGSLQSSARIAVVWLVGYASHLAADACTPSGIPLFCRLGRLGRFGRPIARGGRRSAARGPASNVGGRSLPSCVRRSPAAAFHLLPDRMLIRTGTPADTLLVRWGSWVVFLAASVALFAGMG